MNLKLIKLSFLILIFTLLPVLSLADTSFPVFPMAFWGNATLDGNLLPSGTIIKAYCNNNVIGEITIVEDGIYGHDEATKNKLLVSSCDGDIIFKYLALGTNEDLTGVDELKYIEGFMSGVTRKKHLNFISVQPSSASSSSGGGGGGGGATPPPTYKAGDIDKNNKVDKYDFALIMAAWGKIGTNNSDLNSDNKVDKYDFALLMLNWSTI